MIRAVAYTVFALLVIACPWACSDDTAGSAGATVPHGGAGDGGAGDGGGNPSDAGRADAGRADGGGGDGVLDAAEADAGRDAAEIDAGQPGDGGEDSGGHESDGGLYDSGSTGCGGAHATVSGTTYAPNGVDPIPRVLVYATDDATTFTPPSATVTCLPCAKPTRALARTISADDGTFTLSGLALDAGGMFTVVMDTGSFRRVVRHVAVTACTPLALTPVQTSFAGSSSGDDVAPRIVVAHDPSGKSDVNDKLVRVLDTIGVKYDTVLPDRTGGPTSGDLLGLLGDPARLVTYDIVATPCGVLGNYTVGTTLPAAAAANLESWLKAGGRLYASDLAYSVVAKSAAGAFTWAPGPSPHAGADPGDCGVGLNKMTPPVTSLDGTVDDPYLLAWLQAINVVTAPATTIPLVELRDPWGAVDAVSTQTDAKGNALATTFVSANVEWYTGSSIGAVAVHPMTAQVDITDDAGKRCGRVVFTSYHVQTSASAGKLSPQEHVLEYLLFQLSRCVNVD